MQNSKIFLRNIVLNFSPSGNITKDMRLRSFADFSTQIAPVGRDQERKLPWYGSISEKCKKIHRSIYDSIKIAKLKYEILYLNLAIWKSMILLPKIS